MISEEFISNLANKYQTNVLNVRREYFQHIFLSYFYQQPKAQHIYFKGGTALRILHNSPRFSEDLDFSSPFITFKEIEDLLLDTLSCIEKENIGFTVKESKQTSGEFLAIVSFEAFLPSIDVKIEVSFRKVEKEGEVVAVTNNDYVPPYTVVSVTEHQLVFGKIRALLDRKKPRDFYDLYFILRSRLIIVQKGEVLSKALMTLNESDINFEKELKQFLPQSHWPIIRDFKATLRKELERR